MADRPVPIPKNVLPYPVHFWTPRTWGEYQAMKEAGRRCSDAHRNRLYRKSRREGGTKVPPVPLPQVPRPVGSEAELARFPDLSHFREIDIWILGLPLDA